MNERTGDLLMSAQVDREAVSEISLRVLAANPGPLGGNHTDMATVRVLVRDTNDPATFHGETVRWRRQGKQRRRDFSTQGA